MFRENGKRQKMGAKAKHGYQIRNFMACANNDKGHHIKHESTKGLYYSDLLKSHHLEVPL